MNNIVVAIECLSSVFRAPFERRNRRPTAADARALWQRKRSKPTAEALAARTLLDEAAALTDPDGMGASWAAEWRVD